MVPLESIFFQKEFVVVLAAASGKYEQMIVALDSCEPKGANALIVLPIGRSPHGAKAASHGHSKTVALLLFKIALVVEVCYWQLR
ncbi:MAG: hypothetical protein F6K65_38475 [Moorea sp. SIO3C2]|nr:hypothetical protein [Moorena sp. SIO3C2]